MNTQVIENIAASNILQEEVDAMIILKHIIHRENERVLGLEQDVLLGLRVQNLALLYEDVFINTLHRVLFLIVLIDHVEHFAEGSFVNDLDNLEVFEFYIVLVHLI